MSECPESLLAEFLQESKELTIPKVFFEAEQQRVLGAMQLLAALFIRTPDDAERIVSHGQHEGSGKDLLEWAEEMREDLQGEARSELLDAIARSCFLTNTHPGYPLSSLNGLTTEHLAGYRRYWKALGDWKEGRLDGDVPNIESFVENPAPGLISHGRILEMSASRKRHILEFEKAK